MVRTVADVPSWELETKNVDTTLIEALETMFRNDYTQLGIKRNDELIGMVSYRSISRFLTVLRRLGAEKNLPERTVEIAVEDASPVVAPDDDLTELFDLLATEPYVLVENPSDELPEIITNYDLLHYLRDSIEPFLLIEDIETAIRDIIVAAHEDPVSEALHDFYEDKDIRTPEDISDCSFGHYPDFMAQNWHQFDEYFQEDGNFTKRLIEEVGDIRNKIFHFRTQPHSSDFDAELLTFAHSFFAKRAPNRTQTPASPA